MFSPTATETGTALGETESFLSPARQAGFVYLILILSGILSIAYVPSRLFVLGDAAATLENLNRDTALFRLGIASGYVCYLSFLLLPLSFHRLLAAWHPRAAMMMVVFALTSVPIALSGLGHQLDALSLLQTATPAQQPTLQHDVLLALIRYANSIAIAKLFWGLWLLPLGWMLWHTRHVPRLLSACLLLGGCGYLLDVFGDTVSADYARSALSRYATRPAAIGEIGTCLWLLLRGAASHNAWLNKQKT